LAKGVSVGQRGVGGGNKSYWYLGGMGAHKEGCGTRAEGQGPLVPWQQVLLLEK